MSDSAGSRLLRQAEVVNKVQRLSNGKEVNLYQIRYGKPAFDDDLRFPNAPDEALLANVTLSRSNSPAKLRAEVWLAKGRLFSLVFNVPPSQFYAGMDLDTLRGEIEDVRICFNPMQPHVVEECEPVDASAFTGWLREWHAQGRVVSLRAPSSQMERETYLGCIDALLPGDYLELLAQTDGARIGVCAVFGVREIRRIVLPDAIFYVLAEVDGVAGLGVKNGGRDATIYRLRYEDGERRAMGSSLQYALINVLELQDTGNV
ncbi:hypothetical protein [Pseudoduganella namucuonensis]|uniref:hypothetical protein n=1 Tax=Pseudoduganella namucuonensis TaxID=1035707 RepID=UPI001160270D|nr:hypothetical protein [Pseudoduganella namucuonensis]